MYASQLSASDVAALLRLPAVRAILPPTLGAEPEVRGPLGRQCTFAAVGPGGAFVLRFPGDAHSLDRFRVEARVTTGLRGRASLRIPDTQVFQPGDAPPFSLHEMMPGHSWFDLRATRLTGEASARLARDVALLMRETHSVLLETAAEWLGEDTRHSCWRERIAARDGRPSWFAGDYLERIRRRLAPTLPADLAPLVEDTAARYDRVAVSSDELVFVHSDLHGGDLAAARSRRATPRASSTSSASCASTWSTANPGRTRRRRGRGTVGGGGSAVDVSPAA